MSTKLQSLSERSKDVIRLAATIEFGKKGDVELLLLKKLHALEDEIRAALKISKGDKGDNGDDYVLTPSDRKEIAAQIKVPIVEKVIERTEVIKEQPIVTEITKVTNEIKEVAVTDSADDIRNKLELLEGEERLDASAIKGLDEYDKRIKGLEGRPNVGGWSSASGGKIIKYYDLSTKLDGVTKTFALPAFWRVVNVQCSSAPNPMRENTDYTIDGSLFTITFTSQVDASTVLAQPQTLIILYAEA